MEASSRGYKSDTESQEAWWPVGSYVWCMRLCSADMMLSQLVHVFWKEASCSTVLGSSPEETRFKAVQLVLLAM